MDSQPSLFAEESRAAPGRADQGEGEEGEGGEEAEANLHGELQEFRQRWQRELYDAGQLQFFVDATDGGKSKEDQANILFRQGMQAEQDGNLYEAIHYYRRAMQLVPDIETKMDFFQQFSNSPRTRQDSESSVDGSVEVEEDLVEHFHHMSIQDQGLCQPDYEQRATHISTIPMEVLMYIFRWVVSSQLDMRSLEILGQVCRGFYLCARDEGLWKVACLRIWGNSCGSSKKYGGWRRMFLDRPHLLFNGCYISRTTYVRQGEQGMDSFYSPFHCVAYYRYMRFLPEGSVMMMCSPEEPTVIVPKLHSANTFIQGMMKGYYKLSGSKVMCILKRVKAPEPVIRYKRQQRQNANLNDMEQTFTMEFEMTDNNRRCHRKLNWASYSVRTLYKGSGEETVGDFELTPSLYPPLIFSRVRSYTASVNTPLE